MIADVTGTRAVIAAAALTLALAGCSDDPEPRVADPTPTAPSTTEASGPTPPEMPEAAKGTDAAAAEAFVKFYWEMVNYAQQTGDVDALQELSSKCVGCDAGIASIERTYSQDGSIVGGDGRVVALDTGFIGENFERAVVRCVVVSREQTIDLPGEKNDKTYGGGRQPLRFILDPSGDAWVVRSMGAQ